MPSPLARPRKRWIACTALFAASSCAATLAWFVVSGGGSATAGSLPPVPQAVVAALAGMVTPVSSSAGPQTPAASVSVSAAATAAENSTRGWEATPVGASLVWANPTGPGGQAMLAWLVQLRPGRSVYPVGGRKGSPAQRANNWVAVVIDATSGNVMFAGSGFSPALPGS